MNLRFASLFACLLAALALAFAARAEDVFFLKNGTRRAGVILGMDAANFRLQVPLARPPGAAGPAPFASITVPRADVQSIEFAADPAREQLLQAALPAQVDRVAALWQRAEPLLSMPRSPAGRIGLAYADLLLRTGRPGAGPRALGIFQRIETSGWNPADQAAARQGRLRAMVATGNVKAAVAEATALARSSEDSAVLIEAQFILGRAAEESLRRLVAENPRWTEDDNVIPEHARLLNEALDHYLYAALFHGAEAAAASRGLDAAVDLYRFAGDLPLAVETARDITAFYPGTPAAARAATFLHALTKEPKQPTNENEARN